MEYIYKITSPSGKSYIGRTKNLNKRLIEHRSLAKTGKNKYSIHKAILKYGWDNMKVEILDMAPSKDIEALEEKYIIETNSLKIGYNETIRTTGGNIWEGKEDTQEFIEFKKHMSEVTKGEKNGMYGKSHSEQTKTKQKQKAAGRFSLPWYIERNGKEEGKKLYEERCQSLKNRNLKKDSKGKFIKA